MRAITILLLLTLPLSGLAAAFPAGTWETAAPADVGMDGTLLEKAREYALTGDGSGTITRHGKRVLAWGDIAHRYDLKSTSKSIGATAFALAVKDGKMKLEDKAVQYHSTFGVPPEGNRQTGWLDRITLRHLATQTAGFEKPGGYTKLVFEPGTQWLYSDGGPNWLAECVTLVYGRDIEDLLFERVFSRIGIQPSDLRWRNNAYRDHQINGIPRREFGSGVHANVDAMARIGYLYLRGGAWNGQPLLPSDYVALLNAPLPGMKGLPEAAGDTHGNASDHYSLLWWNNADGSLPEVPRDAYWSWGLYDSLIVVIPSLDIVVSRAGKSWARQGGGHYDVLKPFLNPIVASVQDRSDAEANRLPANLLSLPYPPSPVIRRVNWAPKESIIRLAEGSDNWPMTWADDDRLYTAYGDGWGFVPKVPEKLSLGLAVLTGNPPAISGTNLRSASAEQKGQGAAGKKTSGMLMVDRVLYMWVRNAGNSQLAWSNDHGRTWTWSEWKFETSFGAPTFLNFGKNYAGARDNYVYIFSHDSDSAYEPSDRMVLARVPKSEIRSRGAYRFLQRLDAGHRPVWTDSISERGAVFTHTPKRCYRSGITYNVALGRYLWCQIIPGPDTRFRGGFAIYDAPEPWGPWTTAFFTEEWDVGPGETSSLPTKWMSPDGKTLHLVFSGDDFFSVRKATLELR